MNELTTNALVHTKTWSLRLDLFEEGDLTWVHAILDTGANRLESRTEAHRNPRDPSVPEIGDEYAAGRALVDLGHQLLRAGMTDARTNEPPLHG